ncbi:MAG: YfcE family phosphodiesterase, partial [Desulfurococcaceae archaeon]
MVSRILAIGDFHIPSRARWVPKPLELEVSKETYDLVVCTGDLTSLAVMEWLRKLGKKVYAARGNMDRLDLPVQIVIRVDQVKVGINHGFDVYPRGDVEKLLEKAKELCVDVLVTGHTHYPQVIRVEPHGVVIVNPGSATGVWGGDEKASLI